VPFSELTRSATAACGVRAYKLCSVHAHTVSQIIFVPELDAFISCSSIDADTSVYIGDIYHRKLTRMALTKAYAPHCFSSPAEYASFVYLQVS